MRLDLRLLALLLPLRLFANGLQIRPNPGDEGDASAVRKPAQAERAGRDRSESPRLAAVGSNQVHLGLLVVLALRGERDPFAVRRPNGLSLLVARGEPTRLPAIRGKEPQLGGAFVRLHVVD